MKNRLKTQSRLWRDAVFRDFDSVKTLLHWAVVSNNIEHDCTMRYYPWPIPKTSMISSTKGLYNKHGTLYAATSGIHGSKQLENLLRR